MGSKDRAESESERLGMSSPVKKFLKFLLARCGNCVFRITCWHQLFPDKGKLIMAYREVFFCDGHYTGSSKAGFDGKQVVNIIKNCSPCVYMEPCGRKILDADEFLGMVEATSPEMPDHVAVIKKCADCPDNEACWSDILKGLGFGWTTSTKMIKIMTLCKFEKEGDGIDGKRTCNENEIIN